MTLLRQSLSGFGARAGELACACGLWEPGRPIARRGNVYVLALGFGVAALAQALAAGLLPLMGAGMVPEFAGVPYAAMLAGAAIATFPASFLLDGFGRRTAFALGASMGIAGGLLVAAAIFQRQFVWLCLGAFWIGIAQGFGFFYRHAAALGRDRSERTAAIAGVFAAGSLAGLAGPSLANWVEAIVKPYFFVGTSLLIALCFVGSLAIAVAQPPFATSRPNEEVNPSTPRGFLGPTLLGAAAWFAMNALMVATPLSMLGCGIAAGAIFGAVSWHVVAMYAPAALMLLPGLPRLAIIAAGIAAFAGAVVLQMTSVTATSFTVALAMAGIGWSLVTVATTAWLHDGHPSRGALALHDGLLFAAAIGGSILGGLGVARA